MGYWDPDAPGSDHPQASGRPGRFVPGPGGSPRGRRFDGYLDEPHTGGPYVRSFKTAAQEAREICAQAAGDDEMRAA
jgi:hypothetical protein